MRVSTSSAAAAAILLLAAPAFARPSYTAPNESDFPAHASWPNDGCLLCHNNQDGGYGCAAGTEPCLNVFGEDFWTAGALWTPWLAYQDSDSDGWLNGQELGDPDGNGTVNYGAVSHPGNAGGLSNTPGAGFSISMCNYDDCAPRARCSDGSGASYTCTCSTADGWQPSGGVSDNAYLYRGVSSPSGAPRSPTCVNYDECANVSGLCAGPGTCADTSPGYTCNCPDATYVLTGTWPARTLACTSGCDQGAVDCDARAECTPTATSPHFRCDCWSPTLSGDGTTCSNVDECDANVCGVGVDTCTNLDPATSTAPGYSCTCVPGYRFDGTTCVDIDECNELAANPCNPVDPGGLTEGTCVESTPPAPPNTWVCTCAEPRFASTSGTQPVCLDVDECLEPVLSRCSSNATCTNTYGGNDCECNPGWEGDGQNCIDIDECAIGTHACDVNAVCDNIDGAYRCECESGWDGSGFVCVDANECATGTHGCGLNETCVNQVGAPNLCECARGYSRTAPEAACVVTCGDGQRGPGEACDDGDLADADGCSAACAIELGWACSEDPSGQSVCAETCGDGLVDAHEECDDGAARSDSEPNACRTSCRRASCGDGVVDEAETCDEGDDNSDVAANGCRTSCDPAYCGDGVLDDGEVCDPGGGDPEVAVAGTCTTACAPDAGIDPDDPPVLTGGSGCASAPAGQEGAGFVWLLLGAALALRRRAR